MEYSSYSNFGGMMGSILIVSENYEKLKKLLKDYRTERACSEEEALSKVSSNKFDLVLIEDNVGLMDKIKEKYDVVGVLILEDRDFDKSKDYYYVFKPYKEQQLLSIIHNSLNKVKLERELRNAKEFMRNIMDSSLDSIITADLQGKITSFNKGAESVLGYKAEEMIGKNVEELYPPEEREKRERWITRILNGESIRNKRVRWIDKHGNLHDISLSISLLRDSDGNPIGTVGIGKDITKEVMAERQLREYIFQIREYIKQVERSNMFKELLLDILKHDILNPLTVIKNVAHTIEKEKSELIIRNVGKIEDIIKRASIYSKLESVEELEFEQMDLAEVIEGAVDSLRNLSKKKEIEIEIVKGKKSYNAEVSPWIEEAFINLISNAIKYSPAKSKVKIIFEEDEMSIKIGVADLGYGIPDEEKPYIFERFGKGKKSKGMGLGLAIVKRIVELHKGNVWVETNKPRGSIFYIRVPKRQGEV